MVTATSVMVVTKMGNTVPRVGLEPTSLAFRASVLPLHLHHVVSLTSLLYVLNYSIFHPEHIQLGNPSRSWSAHVQNNGSDDPRSIIEYALILSIIYSYYLLLINCEENG